MKSIRTLPEEIAARYRTKPTAAYERVREVMGNIASTEQLKQLLALVRLYGNRRKPSLPRLSAKSLQRMSSII